MKKLRQIDFNEALDLAKQNQTVYVMTTNTRPSVMKFNCITVGKALGDDTRIFFVIEDV